MSIPLEISAAMKTGLETALASVADGRVSVLYAGTADQGSALGDQETMPSVFIRAYECAPNGYRSVMRAYPIEITAATWWQDDRDQVDLYAIMHAVSVYLCTPPSISISSGTFDAFFFDQPPTDGEPEQSVLWRGMAYVRVTS